MSGNTRERFRAACTVYFPTRCVAPLYFQQRREDVEDVVEEIEPRYYSSKE